MARKLKITVLKRDLYKDLVDEYAVDKNTPACHALKDGQEFILDSPNMPDGFCSWAWADLQRDVIAILFGANYPWINKPNTIISCCTDGLRPVTFKLEGMD
jgi:uncharacterized repeat protein (TIGR04076 family)